MKRIIIPVVLPFLLLFGCSRGGLPGFSISAGDVVASSVQVVNTARIQPGKPPSSVRQEPEVQVELSGPKTAELRRFIKEHGNQQFQITVGTNVYAASMGIQGLMFVSQPGGTNIVAEQPGTNLDFYCSSRHEAEAISDYLNEK